MKPSHDLSHSASPVLLAVHDVHNEVHAGFGQARCSVRTLDGVSFAVHAGELVIVHGEVASGAASLLAALSGRLPMRSGQRLEAPSLRIRRGVINVAAFRNIAVGWARTTSHAPSPDANADVTRVRTVYLFRVTQASARTSAHAPAPDQYRWREWASALRQSGDSIVAHLDGALPDTPTPAVRERSTGENLWRDRQPSGVRELTFAAGRIVTADPVRRPTLPGYSDGAVQPIAYGPCPTASPAP